MIVSQQVRRESAARWIGSFLGLFLGIVAVLYLDRQDPDVAHTGTSSAATTAAQPPPALGSTVEVAAHVVDDKRSLPDVDRLIRSLRRMPVHGEPKTAEAERLAKLSPEDLENEVQSATSEAAGYDAEGRYAPERHAQIYRRVNALFDVRGLTTKQNEWLAQAVQALNEIAVRHAEKAMRGGDNDAALRTAESFGEWGYRLNDDQEIRVIAVIRKVSATGRAPVDEPRAPN